MILQAGRLEGLWSFVPQLRVEFDRQAEAYLVLFSGENALLDPVLFLPSQSLRMVVHLPRNRSKPRHGSATSKLEVDAPSQVLPLCDFQLCVMLVLRLSMLLLPGHSGQCPWQTKRGKRTLATPTADGQECLRAGELKQHCRACVFDIQTCA